MARKIPEPVTIEERLSKAKNTLSKIWVLILYDKLKLTPSEWLRLLEEYQKVSVGKKATEAKISFKGNLMVQLDKVNMTWRAFLTGIALLQYRKMTINLKLEKDPAKMTFEEKFKGTDTIELTYVVLLDERGRDYIDEEE